MSVCSATHSLWCDLPATICESGEYIDVAVRASVQVPCAKGSLVNEAAALEQGSRRLVGREYPGFETVEAEVAEAPVHHLFNPGSAEPLAAIGRRPDAYPDLRYAATPIDGMH